MKTLLLLIFPVFSLVTNLQGTPQGDDNVPAEVKKAFQQKYPNVKDVDWEKEGDKYEAEFEANNIETSVLFDANGKLLEIENEIMKKELPASVSAYIKSNYAGYEIEEAAKTETGGIITYEVEVEKGKESLDLIFDSRGNFIKEEKESEK